MCCFLISIKQVLLNLCKYVDTGGRGDMTKDEGSTALRQRRHQQRMMLFRINH